MKVRRVAQTVVGSVLIAAGGLDALLRLSYCSLDLGRANVGGYVFLSVMLGLGMASVIFGSVLWRRALFGSPTAVGSGAADASSAVKVGQVALIALGSLWALLSLIAFAIYDGDTSVASLRVLSRIGRPGHRRRLLGRSARSPGLQRLTHVGQWARCARSS